MSSPNGELLPATPATLTAPTGPADAAGDSGAAVPGEPSPRPDPPSTVVEDLPLFGVFDAIKESTDCAEAFEFNATFDVDDEAEYTWAVQHAREYYTLADTWYKAADEKAGALIGYLGSVAGVAAFGSGAAVAAGQLNRWVALCGVPSFLLAAVSMIFAALARRPYSASAPPTPREAARRATFFKKPDRAAGSMLGQWDLAASMMLWTLGKKASWLNWATWAFVSAVAALVLPLLAGIAVGFSNAGDR